MSFRFMPGCPPEQHAVGARFPGFESSSCALFLLFTAPVSLTQREFLHLPILFNAFHSYRARVAQDTPNCSRMYRGRMPAQLENSFAHMCCTGSPPTILVALLKNCTEENTG